MSDLALAETQTNPPKVINVKLPEKPNLTESTKDYAHQLELKIRKLKKSFEKWKEIIVSINSLIRWEKQWHAGALFGGITSLFLFLWILQPPMLTVLATIGLFITIGDYLIPSLVNNFYRQEEWSGKKEKVYDYICRNLVIKYARFTTFCASFNLLKSTRPTTYYATTIGSLMCLAWIGSAIDNLFLTYLLVLLLVMLPGMESNGVFTKYTHCLFEKVRDIVAKTKSKVA